MLEPYEVVIIGAGQSGLCVSYYLSRNNVRHLVLERESKLASSWRYNKWDSFTFVTPNSMNQLPGMPVTDSDDEFMNKEQVCKYIENFSASFNAPVNFETDVQEVKKNSMGMFEVKTNSGVIIAKQVAIATSCFNKPAIPSIAKNITPDVVQIHSSEYKNPDDLKQGGVLVVGTAQSGAQIIEELVENGRNVYCATSKVIKTPRKYRGKDITRWARLVGVLDAKGLSMSELNGRFPSSPQITGKNGGHEIHLQNLAKKGLVLLGRLSGASEEVLTFDDNLAENMKYAKQSCIDWIARIDDYISDNNLDVPVADYVEPEHDSYENSPDTLNIAECNISTIIWATGYKYDYSWVKENIFDEYNYPITEQGITGIMGLCFVGLPGQDLNKSSLMYGISEHAKHISEYLMINIDQQAKAS